MVSNSKINNFLDKLFHRIIENKSDSQDSITNPTNEDSSSLDKTLDSQKSFKILQLSLKILCLFSFLPYAIFGMYYVNKSFIFIPCLIMATATVLLTMFSSVKNQILNEYLENRINNLANNFKNFILKNQKIINEIQGIEILENYIKSNSYHCFLDKEFITSSLIKGASKINEKSLTKKSDLPFNSDEAQITKNSENSKSENFDLESNFTKTASFSL
jgi:c-di-AMP phosphodiesterase-like protein